MTFIRRTQQQLAFVKAGLWLIFALIACPQLHAGTLPALQQQPTWSLNAYWGWHPNPPYFSGQAVCDDYNNQTTGAWYGDTVTFVPAPGSTTSGNCHIYNPDGTEYHWSGEAAYVTGSATQCPANSTLDGNGTTCSCKQGYEQSPTRWACEVLIEKNQSAAQMCPRPKPVFGDPIAPLTASLQESVQTGVSLRGIELQLSYDSAAGLRPPSPGNVTSLVEPNSFGSLWHSSYHRKLQVAVNKKSALLSRGNGELLTFVGDGAGNFTPDGYNANKLVSVSGGFRFTDIASRSLETYDATGALTSIVRSDGSVLTFSYSGGNLSSVRGDDGRTVQFFYTNNLISKIIGSEAEAITATYDANSNLSSLTWPDGKVQTFVYENTTFPWALTGILDENGVRASTFAYDSSGRAISTERAGGVDRFSVAYASAPTWMVTDTEDAAAGVIYRVHSWQPPQGTNILLPNGENVALVAQSVFGMPLLSSRTQPSGSGAPSAATAITYDSNGNVASSDDFSGQRTCFVHDSSNRETVRVEGLANSVDCTSVTGAGATLPAGARKVTKAWHPVWTLPTQIVEPLRKTTYVYNGQPDPFNNSVLASCTSAPAMPDGNAVPLLCKQVVQATLASGALDPSVPSAAYSFTYDTAGRPLTTVDPRAHTTTIGRYGDTVFPGSNVDSNFGSVALLLHGEGCNGCTDFLDSSGLGLIPSSKVGATLTVSDNKFGAGSISIASSSNNQLAYSGSARLLMSGDFTVEGFLKISSANSLNLFNLSQTEAAGRALFFTSNTGVVTYNRYGQNSQTFSSSTSVLPLNAWMHLAFTRSGSTIRCFVNGVLIGSVTDSAALGNGTGGVIFPGAASTVLLWDEVRISQGIARYTANFSPPTQAFPNTASPDMTATGHTAGDVQTVTDAAGHATQFTLYDPAGHVRQMVDPKGITTDITYTPRGWVSTVTVTPPGAAARTTTYTYDAVGQVTGVSQPDGTSLTYAYDAAHRLTSVSDARGNSVTYTLDNSGNRIGEDTRDPSGTLQRSIARSFDALNRLQQVTGAAN